MTGALWSFLADADGMVPVARRGARELSAAALRSATLSLSEELRKGEGPLFLYCEDAANFTAGLLGALIAGREVLLPAHAAPGYLAEIGAGPASLITDISALEGHRVAVGASEADGPLPPVPEGRIGFFTSGTS